MSIAFMYRVRHVMTIDIVVMEKHKWYSNSSHDTLIYVELSGICKFYEAKHHHFETYAVWKCECERKCCGSAVTFVAIQVRFGCFDG